MPFYFRILLPGPFGFSKRMGGHRRRKVMRSAPDYRAVFPDGTRCHHNHRTKGAAHECARREASRHPTPAQVNQAIARLRELRELRELRTRCYAAPAQEVTRDSDGLHFRLVPEEGDTRLPSATVTIPPGVRPEFDSLADGDPVSVIFTPDLDGYEDIQPGEADFLLWPTEGEVDALIAQYEWAAGL